MKFKKSFPSILITVLLLQLSIVPASASSLDQFNSAQDAAIDFAKIYNGPSIRENREYGANVYKLTNGKFVYSAPSVGTVSSVYPSQVGSLAKVYQEMAIRPVQSSPMSYPSNYPPSVAILHSHAAATSAYVGDFFSPQDKKSARDLKVIADYVVSPSGNLYASYSSNNFFTQKKIADEYQGIKHDPKDSYVRWTPRFFNNHWFGKSKNCPYCAY